VGILQTVRKSGSVGIADDLRFPLSRTSSTHRKCLLRPKDGLLGRRLRGLS
jgi:hypothetical protein